MPKSTDALPKPGGDPSKGANNTVKKRLPASCDGCRQRKVKCDGKDFLDAQCTTCRKHKLTCTYEMSTQRPGVKQFTQQITNLTQRVQELEKLLEQKNAESSPASSAEPLVDITAAHEHDTPLDDDKKDQEYIQMLYYMETFMISEPRATETFTSFFGPSSNPYLMHQMTSTLPIQIPKESSRKPIHKWEAALMARPTLVFPDDDLLQTLITIYFKYRPAYLYALHEPSFRRNVASGFHHIHPTFGAVLLVVCAIASRASSDPRVYLDDSKSEHSQGWKYIAQAASYNPQFSHPSIYDVQYSCLLAEYMLGSSNPPAAWQIVRTGIAFAIELGLHRRREDKLTFRSELAKRVFWSIFILDRSLSLFQGRPVSIPDDEYDLEYPISCDDEYWDTGDPSRDFKQPEGIPSKMDGFICFIKLAQITSFALRTVFNGIQKAKETATDADWTQNRIAVLDSMLHSWFMNVPSHLRWDTDVKPTTSLEQSTEVYAAFYNLQIVIHRPFVHSPSPVALSSLAICTNAARSYIILMNMRRERGLMLSTLTNVASFVAGSAIVLNMWLTHRSGFPLAQRDIDDLEHCFLAMQSWAPKVHMSTFMMHKLSLIMKGLPLDFSHIFVPTESCNDLAPLPTTVLSPPIIPSLYASLPSVIPSGYVSQPSIPEAMPDFGLDLYRDRHLAANDMSQWSSFSQADISLLGDMDTSWLEGTSASHHANGHESSGALGREFYIHGLIG